ncbi:putative ABC transporter permease [Bacteroides acidifaciens]|uniref:putative ABC transporter permease n=1 Tax=Bacteroides acidifaciens TaxID=85831 RepID=UPI0026DEA28B|nr:hypothetical protein [Bacteroides acidifaciens]
MKIKNVIKMVVLLLIGGTTYFSIEMLWRGHSHWTMALVGGVCFILIGAINEYLPWELGMIQQAFIGASIVTAVELIAGLILNVWLKLGIWDYSNMPFNLWGQICLPFFFAWLALSIVAIVIDDYLRYWLFKEEKPHYQLI